MNRTDKDRQRKRRESWFNREITRVQSTIGQLSIDLGVETSCIRYWIQEFDLDKMIKRNKRGDRRFNQKAAETIRRIHWLIKVQGFTIDGARHALPKYNQLKEILK